jgi:hypothetical protein
MTMTHVFKGILAFGAVLALTTSLAARADVASDGAYLDPGFKSLPKAKPELFRDAAGKSNTLKVVAKMTPVRSQAARGTCSIFSATALLEGMMVIKGMGSTGSLDLSEEWMEYLVTRKTGSEGSTSSRNLRAVAEYGHVLESALPYVGETWESVDQSSLSQERCGNVEGTSLEKGCLVSHFDPRLLEASASQLSNPSSELYSPEILNARKQGQAFIKKVFSGVQFPAGGYVNSVSEVKSLLRQGIPVSLGLDFYYGAWNHRVADTLGIGRDMDNWAKGLVGFPEKDSLDIIKSKEDPAGHEILLVGYDDNAEITTTYKTANGGTRTKTYRGVYYFKNSWGTGSFGAESDIEGENLPGYGAITQKYAETYGGFYALPMN